MGSRLSALRGRAARFGAVIMAMGLVAAGGATAVAQDADAGATLGNITGTTGSLIIHKHTSTGTNGTNATGAALDATAEAALGAALEGVAFDVQPVAKDGKNLDLTTADGWAEAEKIIGDGKDVDAAVEKAKSSDYTLGTATTQVTDKDGKATFSNLPYGLYLVTENKDKTTNGDVANTIDPFLVTIPTYDSATKAWIYDVNVYPKNTTDSDQPTKDVKTEPATLTEGSEFTWEIAKKIDSSITLESLNITDPLDSRFEYVKVDSITLNGTTLVAGTDYTVSADDRTESTSTPKAQNVHIVLTDAGVAKVNAITEDRTLTVELVTKLRTGLDDDANIVPNDVAVQVNDGDWKWTTPTPPDSPNTPDNPNPNNPNHPNNPPDKPNTPSNPDLHTMNYGKLTVVKYKEGEEGTRLKDAEFDVYATDDNGNKTGDAVAHLKTGEDGTASVKLYLGKDTDYTGTFVVVETKAPAGYTLDSTEHKGTVTVGTDTTAVTLVGFEIPNTPNNMPQLPLTGAQGTVLLMALGLIAIALGVGLQVVAVRRRRSQES